MPTATLRAVASASASGASITCNKPAGTSVGDLLIAFQSADSGTFANMTTPTGGATWALLTQQQWSAGEPGTNVWWKFAGGSEPASYGFAQASGADGVVAIAAVFGTATTTPVFASSASSVTTTSIPTPSVTPTGSDDLELRWAASKGFGGVTFTWTPPATYTEQVDLQSNTFTSGSMATKQLTSNAASGIQNFTISNNTGGHMGITVAVAGLAFRAARPLILGQAMQRAAFY
ncbi:hypothetical protein AB0L65_33155 [Nonomuraea sp. NPDC052116]|uniref:hypothetical protein n=1 Tax=Nonomuraea sp. NPDC052116 TaxID=3155665 RepID=UPI0034381822